MTDTYVGAIDSVALLVQVGDGGSPETFAHPCLINMARGIEFSAAATAAVKPDCTDPTKPGVTIRTVTSTDSKITGAGVLDHAAAKVYADWILGGQPKNIKGQAGSSTGDLIVTGAYVLTAFQITGAKLGDLVDCSLTLEQASAPTTSAHA